MTIRSIAAAALLLAGGAAFAADGFVTGDVSLRAGPDTDFPRITVLDEGTNVEVLGCIDGWEWCDVVAYGERGWVAGRFVELEYGGRHVYLYDYGPRLGIPIVSFSIGNYWGDHYRHRSFYGQRDRWARTWSGPRTSYRYSSNTGYRSGYRSGSTYDGTRRYDSRYDSTRSYSGGTRTYSSPTVVEQRQRYSGDRYSGQRYSGDRYSGGQRYSQQTQIARQQATIQQQQAIRQQQVIQQQQAIIQQQARQQQAQQQLQYQQAQQAARNQQYARQQYGDQNVERRHDNGLHRGHYKEKHKDKHDR
jgi:uncharacterized protein YraI